MPNQAKRKKKTGKKKETTRAFSPIKPAIRWDCTRQHIYNLIKRGEIKAFKTGSHDRIPPSEVERVERGE